MNGIRGNRLNDFSERRPPEPEPVQEPPHVYGCVYNIGPQDVTVAVPGEYVPIQFSNNAILSEGISHEAGTAEVAVCEAGDYKISFALYCTATAAAFATAVIQADGENIPGGVFSRMFTTQYQMVSGQTMVSLQACDNIRVVLTSAVAFGITLTGSDVTATLYIKKLN